jgi:hypothetical protein
LVFAARQRWDSHFQDSRFWQRVPEHAKKRRPATHEDRQTLENRAISWG